VPLPDLTLGLVVRYEYLWYRRSGVTGTAEKERPACLVATFRRQERPGDFVIYLPISTRRRPATKRESSYPTP
jgi:hypothetical protein